MAEFILRVPPTPRASVSADDLGHLLRVPALVLRWRQEPSFTIQRWQSALQLQQTIQKTPQTQTSDCLTLIRGLECIHCGGSWSLSQSLQFPHSQNIPYKFHSVQLTKHLLPLPIITLFSLQNHHPFTSQGFWGFGVLRVRKL